MIKPRAKVYLSLIGEVACHLQSGPFHFMAKRIKLTKGKYAIVDDEDYEWLMEYRWTALKNRGKWYTRRIKYKRGGGYYTIQMHRAIMKAKRGKLSTTKTAVA